MAWIAWVGSVVVFAVFSGVHGNLTVGLRAFITVGEIVGVAFDVGGLATFDGGGEACLSDPIAFG